MKRKSRQLPHARKAAYMIGGSVLLALVAPTAAPAFAADNITATEVSATVSQDSVRAAATLTSSTPITAQRAGICARDEAQGDVDFPAQMNEVISSSPTTFTGTATFAPGRYTYWACVQVGESWIDVSAPKSFTVADTAPTPTPTPTPAPTPASASASDTNPSGIAMPTGNLPGWKQIFTEEFTTPLARGSFPGAYSDQWLSYDGFPNTYKNGDYDQEIISAQDGNLDISMKTVDGRPLVAAPVPLVNGQWGGQTYGRYSVRMKADPVVGYGTAFLLWPDSENWNDGEIDFPEGHLDGSVKAFNHCPENPMRNCLAVPTSTTYAEWHTYTIDWTPDKLSFLVDGTVVGSTTSNIPSKPLHWVLQGETPGSPSPTSSGHLLIDWVTMYSYAP